MPLGPAFSLHVTQGPDFLGCWSRVLPDGYDAAPLALVAHWNGRPARIGIEGRIGRQPVGIPEGQSPGFIPAQGNALGNGSDRF